MPDVRRLESLTRDDAIALLGSVSLGRVVFTHLALPAIRPVNHIVDGDRIIIRARLGSDGDAVADGDAGTVVAYEADLIDPDDHVGWTVIVVGRATRVTGAQQIARYQQALRSWADGDADQELLAIRADIVDGYRLVR